MMEFIQYVVKDKDKIITKFWIDENGGIDTENLPCKDEIALLLKTLRLRNVEIEWTGRIENE